MSEDHLASQPLTLEGAAARARLEKVDRDRQSEVPAPGRAKLRVVNPDGELESIDVEQLQSALESAEQAIEGLEHEIRSLAVKNTQLKRDRAREAKASQNWPAAVEAFAYWKAMRTERTGRASRSTLTVERFFLVDPYLERDGLPVVKLAIDGAEHDPYRADRPNRNGSLEIYDGWETIFKNRGAFDRHVNRAPIERIRAVREAGDLPPPFSELELRVKVETLVALAAADPRPMRERIDDAIVKAWSELGGEGDPFRSIDALRAGSAVRVEREG